MPAPAPSFAPTRWTDPRRLGALVGLAGAFVFVRSSASALGGPASLVVTAGVWVVILAAVLRLFWQPRWLGTFHVPRTGQLLVYVTCVVGELALIRVGSLQLAAGGHTHARPALIAAVVGLHFLPLGWALGERMFALLGTALVVLGTVGLALELAVDIDAAPEAAVAAGWVMAVLILAYAWGSFARPAVRPGAPATVDRPAS